LPERKIRKRAGFVNSQASVPEFYIQIDSVGDWLATLLPKQTLRFLLPLCCPCVISSTKSNEMEC
jgi:hypothetical protein